MQATTREPQYQRDVEIAEKHGLTTLGLMTNQAWHDDPKHLLFTAARYKFVAKMLSGVPRALEVGCADAFFTRIVLQEVGKLTATDFDALFVSDVKKRMEPKWAFDITTHDLLSGSFPGQFEAAYALDVIEHINPSDEDTFVKNIVQALTPEGFLILGSPSLESQTYASKQSREGHINCKTGPQMKELMGRFFHNVFIFSMNDELVHTGYSPMAHYRFALGCNRKE